MKRVLIRLSEKLERKSNTITEYWGRIWVNKYWKFMSPTWARGLIGGQRLEAVSNVVTVSAGVRDPSLLGVRVGGGVLALRALGQAGASDPKLWSRAVIGDLTIERE